MVASIIVLDEILNRSLLVGLTYRKEDGEISEQVQIFGSIVEIKPADAGLPTIKIQTLDDQTWYLPFHIPSLMMAPHGEYILVSTGEKVTDPDLVATWTIYSKGDQENPGGWEPNYSPFHNYDVPAHWDFTYRNDEGYLRELIRKYGEKFLGKTVLIGITIYRGGEETKELVDRKQLFGKITQVSYSEGITLLLPGGEEYALPPDITMLEPAAPGEYHLKANNQVIENPDFISIWSKNVPVQTE